MSGFRQFALWSPLRGWVGRPSYWLTAVVDEWAVRSGDEPVWPREYVAERVPDQDSYRSRTQMVTRVTSRPLPTEEAERILAEEAASKAAEAARPRRAQCTVCGARGHVPAGSSYEAHADCGRCGGQTMRRVE